MAPQRSLRAMECICIMAWQRGRVGPTHESLFQDYMYPEEGTPFSYYYKCSIRAINLGGHKGRTEPESRQRERFGSKRKNDSPRMD